MFNDQTYKLSAELDPPHSSDVKAVLPLPSGRLATASRDQSVGIWGRDTEGKVRLLFSPLLSSFSGMRIDK
jgi:WD40 repeat protein